MTKSAANDILDPVVEGLLTPPPGHGPEDAYEIKLSSGVVLKARWIMSAGLAYRLSEQVDNRTKLVHLGTPFTCKVGGETLELKPSDGVIMSATMIEQLIVEPKISFAQALVMAERNFPVFMEISNAIGKQGEEEVEAAKKD